jgi:hypothetical protein
MPDDPVSKMIPKEPPAIDAELSDFLRWRPELRGKSIRAIQMQLRRERRMKLAAKFVKQSNADK